MSFTGNRWVYRKGRDFVRSHIKGVHWTIICFCSLKMPLSSLSTPCSPDGTSVAGSLQEILTDIAGGMRAGWGQYWDKPSEYWEQQRFNWPQPQWAHIRR